jgi:hypothetical protein
MSLLTLALSLVLVLFSAMLMQMHRQYLPPLLLLQLL